MPLIKAPTATLTATQIKTLYESNTDALAVRNSGDFGNVTAASTTQIYSTTTNKMIITGSTIITSFGTAPNGTIVYCRCQGVCIISGSASLLVPNGYVEMEDQTAFTAIKIAAGWTIRDYIGSNLKQFHVQDSKASGTSGGSSSTATTHIRALQTIKSSFGGCSLNATNGQMSVPAGTYDVSFFATCYAGSQHKAYLYNITDANVAIDGSASLAYSVNLGNTQSTGKQRITFASQKTFELRHYITVALTAFGLGAPVSVGNEVYAEVIFTQVKG